MGASESTQTAKIEKKLPEEVVKAVENHIHAPPAMGNDGSKLTKATSAIITQNQMEAHSARAFVLSCMDFRLLDDIVYFMNGNDYNNNYDQFICAGASLGVNQNKFASWGQAFREHLGLGLELHKVKEMIVIDHDKCGAYKKFFPEMKPEEEREYHVKQILQFEEMIIKEYPELKLHAYYMQVDGVCEKIN